MDELDLLKKDWKKQEQNLPHLSYDEIYRMIWKRSSSIVKWIFIISIIEFMLGTVLNIVLADDTYWKRIEEFDLKEFNIWGYVINYIITFYFIYCFYRNYRRINATDTVKKLMKNILHTRKTVKYYIGFVLISSALTFLIGVYIILHHHVLTATTETGKDMHFDTMQWALFIGVIILILALILGIIWLVYRIVYGILMKRLLKNYKELKNLEM